MATPTSRSSLSPRAASSPFGLSRRQFLSAVPLAALVGSCRRAPYRAEDFVLPERSPIALLDAPSYAVDFADLIERALNTLGVDVRGRRVLCKPNLVEYRASAPINTHPLVVAGAATALLRSGAREVLVGEGPGHRRDIEYLLTSTGLYDQLRDLGVRFVDLNHDDVRVVTLRSRFTGLGELALPVELLGADLVVSLPKLKTHHWAGMTASMKNLFGVVPGAVYGWPKNLLHFRGIDRSIVDLAATVQPGLAIVDGVEAMEGDGPIMGTGRATGFIAVGTDPVAVDSTCARIMGLDPEKIPYLETAGRFLGHLHPDRIEHRGERLERYRTRFEVIESLEWMRLES